MFVTPAFYVLVKPPGMIYFFSFLDLGQAGEANPQDSRLEMISVLLIQSSSKQNNSWFSFPWPLSSPMMRGLSYSRCTAKTKLQVSWPKSCHSFIQVSSWLWNPKSNRQFLWDNFWQVAMWQEQAAKRLPLQFALAPPKLPWVKCLIHRWQSSSNQRGTPNNPRIPRLIDPPKKKLQKLFKRISKRYLPAYMLDFPNFCPAEHVLDPYMIWFPSMFFKDVDLRLRDKGQKARELASEMNMLEVPHQEAW